MKFETATINLELFRHGLRVSDAADIVGTERRGHNRLVLEQDAGESFEIGVALWLLQPDRNDPAVLRRFYFFVVPIGAFDEPNGEPCSARPSPCNQITQISFGVAQVSLNHDTSVRPVVKLRLREKRAKEFDRRVFVRIAFHVEIDESAKLFGAVQDWPQLRSEMREGVGRIGRIHLRIERRNFYGDIYDGEELGVLAERIGPAASFASEMLE